VFSPDLLPPGQYNIQSFYLILNGLNEFPSLAPCNKIDYSKTFVLREMPKCRHEVISKHAPGVSNLGESIGKYASL
jgi:hypothetical protein